MRVFAVRFDNRFGVYMGTLKVGVALSELRQLPQHVQALGDKAFGSDWGRATVQGVRLVVVNAT